MKCPKCLGVMEKVSYDTGTLGESGHLPVRRTRAGDQSFELPANARLEVADLRHRFPDSVGRRTRMLRSRGGPEQRIVKAARYESHVAMRNAVRGPA